MFTSPYSFRIPDSPFIIDLEASNDEYLYVDLDQGVTVVIKVEAEGIVIDAFPKHTQNNEIREPVATTWAIWGDFIGKEERP